MQCYLPVTLSPISAYLPIPEPAYNFPPTCTPLSLPVIFRLLAHPGRSAKLPEPCLKIAYSCLPENFRSIAGLLLPEPCLLLAYSRLPINFRLFAS